MRAVLIGLLGLIVAACASIGRPEGGPKDELPPVFVRSNPAPGAVNVTRPKIDIFFDENLKLDDPSNKIVVSPAQKQPPQVMANGKRISVELRDTLLPNTTYTIDFSDAIRDLNEGNILDGFATDFSTGATIDTLRISGMVFDARNLEPAQGMVVGVYSNLSDTAIAHLPLERVAKTNQYGEFTIRNLKPGTYHIFALDDKNHDWRWDRSENIAFYPQAITPSVERVTVTDTLRSSTGTDSIVTHPGWRYLPDDILLTWFNENYRPHYLRDYERTDARKATFKFGAPTDSLPEITVLNGPKAGRSLRDLSVVETREGNDSIVYWFRDPELWHQDSLLVSARYLKTDTLYRIDFTTDTLKLFLRSQAKPKKASKPKEGADTVAPPTPLLSFKGVGAAQQELNLPLAFEAAEPVATIDSTMWRLEMAVDTLWRPVEGLRMLRDTASIRRYNIPVQWMPGTKYRFTADSLAITGISGEHTGKIRQEFTTKTLEDYGNITFNITDRNLAPDSTPIVVELLDAQDRPVQSRPVNAAGSVTFTYLTPGPYYARAYIDANADSRWTTGNLATSRSPEEVYYYPKKLNLRKNWDIDQDWALFALPVDEQKPLEIKKNKPKTTDKNSRSKTPSSTDPDEDNPDADSDSSFGGANQWGNGSQYNNASRRSSGSTTTGGRRPARAY